MASSAIKKAIGITNVSGNVAPDLNVLIVKSTNHHNEPPEEKYTREILKVTSYSRSHVNTCIHTLSKRLSKTHDWIVALKALMIIQRLLNDGDPSFCQEIKTTRVLNMSDFHDETHSNSWEHSGFVKTYAMFLNQKVELMTFEQNGSSFDDFEEKCKDYLERLHWLIRVLDRVLSCRPTGKAKNDKLVLIALDLVVKDGLRVYGDVCEMVGVLLGWFSEMEYDIGVKVFDQFVYVKNMSGELVGFYNWCEDIGVLKSSEFPNVQRISDELLGGLEMVLREKKIVYDNGSEIRYSLK